MRAQTTMKNFLRLASALFLLHLTACNRPPPCPGCVGEDLAVENEEEGEPPDLPCGGADLLTDDLNCGACGKTCEVQRPGTQYAAGGCVEGECGPVWSSESSLSPPPAEETCAQLCSFGDVACVPGGCSGLTAYVCVSVGDFGGPCDFAAPDNPAITQVIGGCDDPIPYPNGYDPGVCVDFACCCERP